MTGAAPGTPRTPELACAVLSYRDEPFLVEAVRSVLTQDVPIEVVVVNSGGGEPRRRLDEAGLTSVGVHSVAHRLYPGAARNIGIEATRAPLLAFLAADCLALPGWAAARLAAHRAGAAAVASVLTNAYPEHSSAWAALLLLHHRRLAAASRRHRLLYSLSYRRDVFERFGRFREDLRAGEDTEFNARFERSLHVSLAPTAVTAHRYPVGPGAWLAEAFRRGRLDVASHQAVITRALARLAVASRAPRGMAHAFLVAARTAPPDRERMFRAWPLVLAGGVAYVAGAITAPQLASTD